MLEAVFPNDGLNLEPQKISFQTLVKCYVLICVVCRCTVVHLTRFSLLEEGEAQYHQLQGRGRLKEVVQVDSLWRSWMVEYWDNFSDFFLQWLDGIFKLG